MPDSKPTRPQQRAAGVPTAGDATAEDLARQLAAMSRAIERLELRSRDRQTRVIDLEVGVNRIVHNLGRTPSGANITPTVADATFAWAMTDQTPTHVEITTVGIAQPGATLEVW